MQNYSDNEQNSNQINSQRRTVRRASGTPDSRTGRTAQGAQTGAVSQTRRSSQTGANGQARRTAQGTQAGVNGQARRSGQTEANGQARRTAQGAQAGVNGQARRTGQTRRAPQEAPAGQRPGRQTGGRPPKKNAKKNLTPKQAAKKKRRKIVLFIAEVFLLLILVGALWAVNKTQKIQYVNIKDEDVGINEQVKESIEQGTSSMQGYKNIALFGVDSRDKELEKSTRTDTIMIASINLDTKEVKLISVLRDTWLNLSTDSYNKANAAYAKGGPKQAISMLNMNLDLDITDFVTVGFDGLIDVIDAVGGIEIDVKESEIVHLNSYQVSMVGKPDGTLNAAGEPNYYAEPYVEYTPVERSGLQKLNGLQATAYARIRYVGNDFERTSRQRTVLTQVARKAMTLNPATLNDIAEAVFPEVATSLDMSEILSLLSGIASYEIGETASFPFDGYVQTGRVGQASVVIPVDLTKNVSVLHEFLFEEQNYIPSDTVKKCSQKISSDTGVSYSGE